jgi:hypothetical protein
LAELAGWDRQLLASELQGLLELEFDDIELTGFSTHLRAVAIGLLRTAAPIRHFAKKKTATAASRRRERVHVGARRHPAIKG